MEKSNTMNSIAKKSKRDCVNKPGRTARTVENKTITRTQSSVCIAECVSASNNTEEELWAF